MRRIPASWAIAVLVAITFAACAGAEDTAEVPAEEATNPCAPAADTPLDPTLILQGDRVLNGGGLSEAELVAMGGDLWNDSALSTTGSNCATCHAGNYAMIKATFAEPYPHFVQMGKDQAGLDEVTAAEMVQLCMMVPMANDPLGWDSQELAALAAYVESIQPGFDPAMAGGGNPCAANPCAANPCAANPCAGS